MKQTNHAPQPLWRRRLPGYAAMGAASLVLALGLHGLMNARTTVAGTALALTDADAATYGISAVYQLERTPIMWWAPRRASRAMSRSA